MRLLTLVMIIDCLPWWWLLSLLLFLQCAVRAWSSFPIFSSRATIQSSSCEHSSHSLVNLISSFLAQIPWMKESHDLGRPFKVAITISTFSTSSSTASSCYLIWETLVKYDCKGVEYFTIFVELMLRIYMAEWIASTQYMFGKHISLNIHLAISTIVLFFLSATSFCWGV